jgi:hypothetical protein
MDESITGVLFILVALAGVGVAIYGQISRSQHLLHKWAGEHQYNLLLAENRVFRKGPFMWSGKNQTVYRVHVCDEQGNERKGWVRCGDWFLGVLADKVEVKWDS